MKQGFPKYPCHVCGYYTLPSPDSDTTCPVCGGIKGLSIGSLPLLRNPEPDELPPVLPDDTDVLGFYGSSGIQLTANTEYPSIHTPRDLYRILLRCWSRETCASRMRNHWTVENPTLGQCSITSFLAQDIFGGTVYGVPLHTGFFHCYNQVGGFVFDLTSEQFGAEKLSYYDNPVQTREQHFSIPEKKERFDLLKASFLREIQRMQS